MKNTTELKNTVEGFNSGLGKGVVWMSKLEYKAINLDTATKRKKKIKVNVT